MRSGKTVSLSKRIPIVGTTNHTLFVFHIVRSQGWINLYWMNKEFLHSVEGWGPYVNSYKRFTEQCYRDTPHEEQDWNYDYTSLVARYKDTRILRAVRIENDVTVFFLLRLHANVNLVDMNSKTPLMLAARNGILKYVEAVLEVAGVCLNNVNECANSVLNDDDGFTALLYACRNLDKEESSHSGVSERIVQLLLDAGADPNIGTRMDLCIRFAILNRYWDVFWALIAKGATNCSGEGTGPFWFSKSTSLDIASRSGNLEVLRKVVELSLIDEVVTSEKCNEFFHNACSSGHLPSAIFILDELAADHVIDIDVPYGSLFADRTALYNASERGYANVVFFLISKKANVNFVMTWGYDEDDTFFNQMNIDEELCTRTALMAACNNGHFDVVKLLLDANADLNLFDRNGKTALDLARDSGHEKVAEILVSKEDLLVSEGAERQGRWQGPRKR